jgi:hypothetical protein
VARYLSSKTVRDVLTMNMDIDGLVHVLERIEQGEVEVVCRELTNPSLIAFRAIESAQRWSTGYSVDHLCSLHDALVGINVPNGRARAAVDAMERDMGTTLATKSDVAKMRSANKADMADLRQEIALVRKEL